MKICFSVKGVGLANNGGSRTLIRCVETLCELGHDAFFHSGRSYYTWHKANIRLVGGDELPPCDVAVATGYNSYKSVARYKNTLRVGYARGLELWKAPEAQLLERFRLMDHVFANSAWLRDYLLKRDIPTTLQYSGLDTHWFHVINKGSRKGVGALLNNRHKTKRNQDAEALKDQYGLPMHFLNRDIKRPDSVTLNKWYNNLAVWFAPTELEGLHNPPMEAALAGCALVCSDHPRNGMHDYVVPGETALVYPARDLKTAVKLIRSLLCDEAERHRLIKNLVAILNRKMGSRAVCMGKFLSNLLANTM